MVGAVAVGAVAVVVGAVVVGVVGAVVAPVVRTDMLLHPPRSILGGGAE